MQKTVLIAGASRGIGLELSRQYARDGWHVIAGCRTPDAASELQALARDLNVTIHQLDTASDDSVAGFAAACPDEPIDVLIVTAGVAGGERQEFSAFDFEDLANTLNINVAGPLRVARAFVSRLARVPNSRLIAITSQMGSITQTTSTEMMAYRISKAALNEAWKCASIEVKSAGVIAAVVHPGWVSTDMGGPEAPVSPVSSASGIRAVVDRLDTDDAGTFWTWEGTNLPW